MRFRLFARLRHWWHAAHRMTTLVLLGCAALIASHSWANAAEREWLRDAGGVLVWLAISRWLSQQHGTRRVDENGRPIRRDTLRFFPPKEGR